MTKKLFALAGLILALAIATPSQTGLQQRDQSVVPGGQSARQAPAVPADLKALLAPKQSEMLLVAQRYQADRNELSGFYHAVRDKSFLFGCACAGARFRLDNPIQPL